MGLVVIFVVLLFGIKMNVCGGGVFFFVFLRFL